MMISWSWCIALTYLVLGILASEQVSVDQLQAIQRNINGNTSAFCYPGPSNTKQAFISQAYAAQTQGLNILVYPFCLETRELGNKLGNYFHELACAASSGMHFLTVHPQWDITNAINGNKSSHVAADGRLAFLKALPSAIVHPAPLDRAQATQTLQRECKCSRYCWEHPTAPWVKHTALIGGYLRHAVNAYLATVADPSTEIAAEDLSNAKAPLPLIPDVAVQYRCGDNLGFSYRYGILPFTALQQRIPPTAKHIYVLSDHPSRSLHNPNVARCKIILEHLFSYLKQSFPSATVVIKRGGDLFLDYARLTLAKTTICSASSYCFWPAIANEHTAYFPLTPLIAGADTLALAPPFGEHYHWMNESYISNFKGLRPWTQIIDVLTGKMKMP